VGERLARRAETLADRERATAWDPTDAARQVWLGRAYEAQGRLDLAGARFEEAVRLRPGDGYALMHLAVLADRRRDAPAARAAMDRALALDPHNVAIRWEAALLALRLDDRDRALAHLRYLLAVDPAQRDAAFELGRALLAPDEDPQTLLPAEPEGVKGILVAALEHDDLPLASVAWARTVALAAPVSGDLGRRYLQRLLDDGRGLAAQAVWSRLVAGPAAPDNAVWNGGFEAERLLSWGLDWRIQRVWGVDVALDPFVAATGKRSLRLTFNSFPTLDFAGVTQLVAVEPGREYRLEARAKAAAFETRSGVRLEVVLPRDETVLAHTGAIAGTTDWVPLTATVRIPEATSLVRLRVRRERAAAPEGNLGGKVWIDEVSLR
jgi:tetratricopeptide (TPR) repeat protein